MTKYKLSKQELQDHWDDQIRFIQKSIKEFDRGDEKEAQRLATHLRVLFHETQKSKSIFGQLKPQIIFYSIYHDENLTAKIRGKIDVSKNIKHNTARGRSDKFYCSYVDFTDDNIENRIVKAALLKSKKILKEKFSSEASVNGKINFCLNSLRHVKVTNISIVICIVNRS